MPFHVEAGDNEPIDGVAADNLLIQVSIQVEACYNVPIQVPRQIISDKVPIQVVTGDNVPTQKAVQVVINDKVPIKVIPGDDLPIQVSIYVEAGYNVPI